jgi:phosphoserine phosphatase
MSHMLSLIAPPNALNDATLSRAIRELPHPQAVVWLSTGEAAEIAFTPENINLAELRAHITTAVSDDPVDVNIFPADIRRKKLLIADMDSTMIEQECIDELADVLNLKAHVSAITERAMCGEIEFEPALRERVALLKDLDLERVNEVLHTRITIMSGAKTLVRTMKAHGAYTALISGGFTLFTGPISQKIGFDEHTSNILHHENNRLSGTVGNPIIGREAKRARLITLRTQFGLNINETLAVGDGANDLDMIHESGLGVAFHAKPAVSASADASVTHTDLTALLFLQGYARHEFADVQDLRK